MELAFIMLCHDLDTGVSSLALFVDQSQKLQDIEYIALIVRCKSKSLYCFRRHDRREILTEEANHLGNVACARYIRMTSHVRSTRSNSLVNQQISESGQGWKE